MRSVKDNYITEAEALELLTDDDMSSQQKWSLLVFNEGAGGGHPCPPRSALEKYDEYRAQGYGKSISLVKAVFDLGGKRLVHSPSTHLDLRLWK